MSIIIWKKNTLDFYRKPVRVHDGGKIKMLFLLFAVMHIYCVYIVIFNFREMGTRGHPHTFMDIDQLL